MVLLDGELGVVPTRNKGVASIALTPVQSISEKETATEPWVTTFTTTLAAERSATVRPALGLLGSTPVHVTE
jgi:hypothetical protein